ncbi:MAG: F0F1 ATP synthase subunit epsilon [Planctomycetota bacterium]|nr:F0F1 ATP synthase subunit epsilon [Planctomycetaceae bacterium]MDQ3331308.1 F0F1 ATP synthase subunit epsilon [Planctomycetota bacterium]
MAIPNQFRLVVVTPEKTLLDESVDSVQVPLYDGMAGIFPGRAPMVGRLGFGEMAVNAGGSKRVWFIDGGFVQVSGNVTSVLTNRAVLPEKLEPSVAEKKLAEANAIVPKNEAAFDAKEREQERNRRIISVARKSR